MALVLVGLAAGGVTGFILHRRAKKADELNPDGERRAFCREVLTVARHAALTGLVHMRIRVYRAYRLTTRQYAPVPLTYTKALLSAFLPIYTTMMGSNLTVWSAGRLLKAVFVYDTGAAMGPGKALGMMASLTSGYWLHAVGVRAWEKGCMRGGLAVFGASPSLDRCASSERYIAEKLVTFGNLGLGTAKVLPDLAFFVLPKDVDKALEPVAVSMRKYARTVCKRMPLLPEIKGQWAEFAERQTERDSEFKELAQQVKYPSSLRSFAEPVLSTSVELRTFGTRIADVGERWEDLRKELGHQDAEARVLTFLTGGFAGMLLGIEGASFLSRGDR